MFLLSESSQEKEGDSVLRPAEVLDEREALDSASDDAQKSIKVVEDMPKRKVCRTALFSTK